MQDTSPLPWKELKMIEEDSYIITMLILSQSIRDCFNYSYLVPGVSKCEWTNEVTIPGHEMVNYEAPQPTAGIHRLVFVLFRQTDRQTVRAPADRENFSTRVFAQHNSLGPPVGAVYFNCQREKGAGGRRFMWMIPLRARDQYYHYCSRLTSRSSSLRDARVLWGLRGTRFAAIVDSIAQCSGCSLWVALQSRLLEVIYYTEIACFWYMFVLSNLIYLSPLKHKMMPSCSAIL